MNYPSINAKELPKLVQIVEQAVAEDDYLDPANCPYDEGTIGLIRRLIDAVPSGRAPDADAPTRGKVGRPTKGPIIPMDEVEAEIDEIRKELASLKIEGTVMETSDRIQVIKTRAALIERVIGMKERTADLKRYHNFVRVVIDIMEQHLSPKERESVMKELKHYEEA
jgi:hypothetical protein